jgi:phospholipase C
MRAPVFSVAGLLVLAACSRGPAGSPIPMSAPETTMRAIRAAAASTKIKHIVFIVQENRTFDNMFGGPNPLPGAATVAVGQTLTGTRPLKKIELEGGKDPNNFHAAWMRACNPASGPPFKAGGASPCKMNGESANATPAPGVTPIPIDTLYSYVDYGETKPYWTIAKTYAVGDHFFTAHNSDSYTAHQYIFSAQSNNVVDAPVYPSSTNCGLFYAYCAYTPWGCDSPAGTTTFYLDPTTGKESATPTGPLPCFGPGAPITTNYPSLADLVTAKGLSWRLYAYSLCSNIDGLDVNGSIRYSSLWPAKPVMSGCHAHESALRPTPVNTANFRAPETSFLDDEKSGKPLANVTWLLPGPITSDHPGVPFGYCGPTWVASVIDAIGASKTDWNSTVIFIFWDDWGGFYDHVAPYVVRDQAGPGFRVPLLVVSPYVNRGEVVHTDNEFATLIKFAETTFGLGSLGATDASPYLNNLDDYFDFDRAPATFTPIPGQGYDLCGSARDAEPLRHVQNSRWLRMIDD